MAIETEKAANRDLQTQCFSATGQVIERPL
jgi:hypothetical protein